MARVPYLERDQVSPELQTSGTLAIVTLLLLLGVTVAGADPLRTDFTKTLVPLEEIVSGGPPPDGIPAIDRPVFVAVEVPRWGGSKKMSRPIDQAM